MTRPCAWQRERKMELFVFPLALGASFVLGLGLARVLLSIVLRVTGMGEPFHDIHPMRTSPPPARGDAGPANLLAA